jgi:hypothetical protein
MYKQSVINKIKSKPQHEPDQQEHLAVQEYQMPRVSY